MADKSKSSSYQSLPSNDPISDQNVAACDQVDSPKSNKVLVKLCLAIGVSVSWALGRQFTKSALIIDTEHFYAPYFLVWFNTCFMILCYPVFLLYNRIINGKTFFESHSTAQTIFSTSGFTTWWAFLKSEMPFVVLWILANYSYSQALGFISASAAMVLVSTNVAVVCVLERILLEQKFIIMKVIAVVLSMIGVVLTSFDEQYSGSWLGIFLTISCAIFVAFYKVLFKLINGNADLGQTSIFLSGLGTINLFINSIPMVTLILSDLEHVELNYIPWIPLTLAAVLSTVFNFLTNFGIALIGPFAISVGMLLGIPLSTAIDIVVRSMSLTIYFLIGSLAISLSFILVVFPVANIYQRMKARIQHK